MVYLQAPEPGQTIATICGRLLTLSGYVDELHSTEKTMQVVGSDSTQRYSASEWRVCPVFRVGSESFLPLVLVLSAGALSTGFLAAGADT